MIREETNSDYASFDVKTVQNKLDLSRKSSYSLPMAVDLETGEIVIIDLYVKSFSNFSRVEESKDDRPKLAVIDI